MKRWKLIRRTRTLRVCRQRVRQPAATTPPARASTRCMASTGCRARPAPVPAPNRAQQAAQTTRRTSTTAAAAAVCRATGSRGQQQAHRNRRQTTRRPTGGAVHTEPGWRVAGARVQAPQSTRRVRVLHRRSQAQQQTRPAFAPVQRSSRQRPPCSDAGVRVSSLGASFPQHVCVCVCVCVRVCVWCSLPHHSSCSIFSFGCCWVWRFIGLLPFHCCVCLCLCLCLCLILSNLMVFIMDEIHRWHVQGGAGTCSEAKEKANNRPEVNWKEGGNGLADQERQLTLLCGLHTSCGAGRIESSSMTNNNPKKREGEHIIVTKLLLATV